LQTSYRQLAAFAEVAFHRSFSRAATSMGVTQSSVTQLVAKLEQQIGSPLFARRRKGLDLTFAGREFLDLAEKVRNLDGLITSKIEEYAGDQGGCISVIANTPFPALHIISNFAEMYPKVEIEVTMLDWSSAMEKLVHRQVDVAIICEPKFSADLITREISSARYVAYMREDHRLASSKIININQLAGHRLILLEEGSLTDRIFQRCLKEHMLSLENIIRTSTYPMLKELVLHGAGIGIVLENSMNPTTQAVSVPIFELPDRYSTFVVAPKEKSDLRLIRGFFEVASELVG
jgi:DNA-binding transcriptional LysR family regulator